MKGIWRNRDGAVVHLGGIVGVGGDTGLPPSDVYYCGRLMNQCRCGQCDGTCGPTNGCPCNACKALLRANSEGAVVHLGSDTGYGGDTRIPGSQVYYCGRKMNQCRCGKCNGFCGPNNGCPCNACKALLRRNADGAIVRIGGDTASQYGGDTGLPANQIYYCGRVMEQCRCGRCDGVCGPSNGCPCEACKTMLSTNSEGAVVHLGTGDYGAYCGDTGLPPNQVYYCGRRMNQCRCGKCDEQCGPTKGCPCNSCKALLRTNSDGAVVHLGSGTYDGGDTGLPPTQLYYCSRLMNQCRCGRCDGTCGPTNGCPCDSCLQLVSNGDGAIVHLGSGGYGGDTGLHPRQIYYCGRKMDQCRCGKCDGRCGPTNGCPCDSCKRLLQVNSDGAIVHLGGGAGSGGDTGLPPNQVYYCGRRLNKKQKKAPISGDVEGEEETEDDTTATSATATVIGGVKELTRKPCRCGRCGDRCGPSSGCPCDSCKLLVVHSNPDGMSNHMAFSKCLSLDKIAAMVSIDSDPSLVALAAAEAADGAGGGADGLSFNSNYKVQLPAIRVPTAEFEGPTLSLTPTPLSPTTRRLPAQSEDAAPPSALSSVMSFISNIWSPAIASQFGGAASAGDSGKDAGSGTAAAPAPASAPESWQPLHELCVVCMDQFRNATIVHGRAGHVCCCYDCALILKQNGSLCPTCKAPIQMVVKLFLHNKVTDVPK